MEVKKSICRREMSKYISYNLFWEKNIIMRKIIVNADDFGLTSEINHGIVNAFKYGIVTSTSLVASGDSFKEAVELAHQNPNLDVGVHLTLTGEKPVLSEDMIPSLLSNDGLFFPDKWQFMRKYFSKYISKIEIEKEYRAQIEKIKNENIKISHIDSHQHLHVLPGISGIVLKIARNHGIKYVRYPREKIDLTKLIKRRTVSRVFQQIFLNFVCVLFARKLRGRSVRHFKGFFDGGHLNKEILFGIVRNLENCVTEVMCHPGIYIDGSTGRKYPLWGYNWEGEMESLKDEEVINYLKEKNITLVKFSSLSDG